MKNSKNNSASHRANANRRKPGNTKSQNLGSRDGELMQKDGGAGKPVEPATRRPISERKLRANRANSKRSTGPRTAQGKYYSRRNAQTHGLSSRTILFRPDGTPIDPELQAVWTRLREQYGNDVGTEELLQDIVAEWWRQRRSTEIEKSSLQNALKDSGSGVSFDKLQRHKSTSQRALLKLLARLRQLAPTTSPTKKDEPGRKS